MQKGKHQVGQTQGYSPRNYSAYPGNPDNSRQYLREVPAFHASGTPGGGPGMRGMHHAPPTQPPTPPTSQDIKQPPAHLPPQAHQMPPQSGGQIMQYSLPGAGRGSTQQTPFYPPSRAPLGSQRMTHARPSVVVSNSAQSFMPQPVVPPVYQGHVLSAQMSGQGPLFVGSPMSQPFQIQQPRHQGGSFYSTPQYLVPQHTMFTHFPQQTMYYTQSIQTMSRAGGPAPSSQGAAPAQPQPPLGLIPGHGGTIISNPGVTQQVKTSRPKKVLKIINPNNGRNIFDDMNDNDNTSSRSGESSARQTPQPNTGQNTDQGVAGEFAAPVAIAARVDHTGSPNPPVLQKSSSRTSNYSESESQASPDPQGVSPSKLDTSVESISGESQIVENNITYDGNQPGTMIRGGGWSSVIPGGPMPVELLPMPMHPGMMIPEDMMRAGSIPGQPAREYQAVQPTQWIADGNAVPVSIMMSEEPASQMESPVQRPERVTPVVSALAHGPTVDIGPRPQREQFPVLGKGHQQQSPVKRKQRSEKSQEQGDSKAKDQQQQQTQPQQSKVVTQTKHKAATPTVVDNKKQPQPQTPQTPLQQQQQPPPQQSPPQQSPPSQDSEEYVQSVQTKSSEPKTIIIKKNESDSSGTKVQTKSEDSLKSKESNNVDSKNLSEEKEVEETSRIGNESTVKCGELSRTASKDCSPTPVTETAAAAVKVVPEDSSASLEEKPEIVAAPTKDTTTAAAAPVKTNGEAAIDEDAKSNNQKSKPGNKRPAQSKMRLEAKDSRSGGEPNPAGAGVEATQSTTAGPEKNQASTAAVTNNQVEKIEKEEPTTADEEEEKDKSKEDSLVNSKNENNKQQTTSGKTNDATNVSAVANKMVLKHNYEKDQWSPINLEGKKKYDRQFIMALQHQPQSMRKPTNFPNLELLSDNKQRPFDRNVINSMNRSHVDNIYPSFANKNSSQRGQTIPKRGSQQGKPKPAKPALVQVSLQQDVKLHETENAWKPARITESANQTEETETEALYKRVRGILNKLTPEKLDKLVAQVQELPIDNSKRLEGVIDLVFKKAVDEPSFSVAYARMCYTLHGMEVPCEQEGGTTRNFRKLLVERCQRLFEKNWAAELNREERLKEIEAEKNPEKKKALQLALEEEGRRIRMKSVGNIRFIGELYKLKMLTTKVMLGCVNELLLQGDEESLECLCKLLTTVGQDLETQMKIKGNEKNEKSLNEHFKKLHDIVKNRGSGKVSSRVRFMIQDLIDLKASKWVPRRNESQPKTIDQIQKEAERETIQMNLALNAYQEKNRRQESRNSLDGRKRGGGPDSSGWTTVTNSQPNKSKLVVESSKLKLDQSDVEVASTLSLGNRNLFMWGQGASSGKMDDKRSSLPQLSTNKFAVLSTTNAGNYNVKGSSLDKDKFNSYKSAEEDTRATKSRSQHDPNSRSSSRESASSKRDASNRLSSPANNKEAVPANEPSLEELKEISEKAKLVLEDYLDELKLNESTKYLNELFPHSANKDFVFAIINAVMEKKGTKPRKSFGILMSHFITTRNVSKEQFLVGLSKVLGTADDLAIDMPCLWEYLAEILSEMCAKDVITFKDIVSVIGPIKGSAGSAKFLAALVKLLVEMKDGEWLKDRWLDSQVSLTDIINEKDVNDFVKQNNLEFMLGKNIKLELSRMIAERASFDEINTWVSENVGEEKSTEPLFVRTLMAVLLEAAVTKGQSYSYKFDKTLFANYEQLILKYTNHNENLELPCLFAIQAFVHKLEYPPTILSAIFNHLWDASLIATESFKSWRHSKNPQEQEGHAVCVTSLTSFFTHLDETETDDES